MTNWFHPHSGISAPVEDDRSDQGEPLNTAQLRVLIVDDEKAIARQLAEGLTALGHSARFVCTVEDARTHLAMDHSIGVLVTDLRVSTEDGLSLAKEVAANRSELHAVETIIITGHAAPDDMEAAWDLGIAVIRKPFRLAEAGAAVEQSLQASLSRRRRVRQNSDVR